MHLRDMRDMKDIRMCGCEDSGQSNKAQDSSVGAAHARRDNRENQLFAHSPESLTKNEQK